MRDDDRAGLTSSFIACAPEPGPWIDPRFNTARFALWYSPTTVFISVWMPVSPERYTVSPLVNLTTKPVGGPKTRPVPSACRLARCASESSDSGALLACEA